VNSECRASKLYRRWAASIELFIPIYSCSPSPKTSSASNLDNPSRRDSTLSKTALQQRSFTNSLRRHPPFSQIVLEQPLFTRNNEQTEQPVQVSSPFSNPRHGSQSSKVKHAARREARRQIHTFPQITAELQLEIWKYTIPGPRVINLKTHVPDWLMNEPETYPDDYDWGTRLLLFKLWDLAGILSPVVSLVPASP